MEKMASVEETLFDIIAKESSVERAAITPDAKLEDLGVESIELVEIVFTVEETFDIEVPYNANNAAGVTFETVNDVVSAVQILVAEKAAQSSDTAATS